MQEPVEKQTFPRAEYRELSELALIWLGGELPGSKQLKFCKPGAFHLARFMSKAIYLLKMDLLSERIFFTDEQQRQPVRKMATFIGLYYARFFLCSRIVSTR